MVFNHSVRTRGIVYNFLFSRPVIEWVQKNSNYIDYKFCRLPVIETTNYIEYLLAYIYFLRMIFFKNIIVFVKWLYEMRNNICTCIKYIIIVISILYPLVIFPIWLSAEFCEVYPEKILRMNSFLWQQPLYFYRQYTLYRLARVYIIGIPLYWFCTSCYWLTPVILFLLDKLSYKYWISHTSQHR